MNINSINGYNCNQSFQARIKIGKAQIKELSYRTASATGASLSAVMASDMFNANWHGEECAPTACSAPALGASCLMSSVFAPEKFFVDETEYKDIVS